MRKSYKKIFKALRHKWFVLLAGLRLGVPVRRLLLHDMSSLGGYDEHLALDDRWVSDVLRLQHYMDNDHHWQHWSLAFAVNNADMPAKLVLEMVADWWAVSMDKAGVRDSWNDMVSSYEANRGSVGLSWNTRLLVESVLYFRQHGLRPDDILSAPLTGFQ